MSGAIHPPPNILLWRGAQLKHRDNFTFIFNSVNLQIKQLSVFLCSLKESLNKLMFLKKWRGMEYFCFQH
jgi:hypothetical protein